MKRSISVYIAIMLCSIAILTSCSSNDKWHVDATINGADGKTAILEVSNNGRWHVIDSTKVDGNSKCEFGVKRSQHPDIYRLTIDNRSIYFPVDSTETITITANMVDMATRSSISGANSADMMQEINTAIADALDKASSQEVANDIELKRQLAKVIQKDWSNIVSYYLINKTIGTQRLYNPANPFDRGIISAVANAYITNKPNDPRTKLLEEIAIANRRSYAPGTPINAVEIYFPEVSLKDFNNQTQTLSALWENSKVTILNFTAYTAEESPAFQLVIGEVYNKYHDKGLNIYQIGCDPEEYLWRMAAENIPWTAVYCSSNDAEQLMRYNVTALPTTFVIDASGEKIERVDDITKLDATVAKYL